MERANIIKKFLNSGLQLDKSALDYFESNEKDVDPFLEKSKSAKSVPRIVTSQAIQKILNCPNAQIDIKITELGVPKKRISVSDMVKSLSNKYNLLKTILEKRNAMEKLISINKISQNTKEFSVICMISSADEGLITADDMTGEITFSAGNKEKILPGDVIGVACEQKEGTFLAREIIWPDIPLNREVVKSKKKINCSFIGVNFDGNVDTEIAFVFGHQREPKPAQAATKIVFLDEEQNGACKPPLTAEVDGINIAVLSQEITKRYEGYWNGADMAKNLLKRRNIDPLENCDGQFVLVDPPDIMAFSADSAEISNYKGTTIISVPKNGGYNIDLSTREVKKL